VCANENCGYVENKQLTGEAADSKAGRTSKR